jgi:hypothetical protein
MVLPELEFTVKISYVDENGFRRADTSTLFYYLKSNISTKNAFEIISQQLKDQLNLNKEDYFFINYNDTFVLPFNTQSSLPIYKEFNSRCSIPFYIHIHTNETYRAMLNFIQSECPICLNRVPHTSMISPYLCGHGICNDCYQRCRLVNHNCCCYCRESQPRQRVIVH